MTGGIGYRRCPTPKELERSQIHKQAKGLNVCVSQDSPCDSQEEGAQEVRNQKASLHNQRKMVWVDGLSGEVLVSIPEDLSWDLQHPHKHQVQQHMGVTQVLGSQRQHVPGVYRSACLAN